MSKITPATRMVLGRDVFTCGMVGTICGVAARTVAGWCDSRQLRSFRVAARNGEGHHGGDRRVFRGDLLRFLREKDMECVLERLLRPEDQAPVGMTLLVGVAQPLRGELLSQIELSAWTGSLFAAGAFSRDKRVSAIIFDSSLGRSEIFGAIQCVSEWEFVPRVVVLAPEDGAMDWPGDVVLFQPAKVCDVVKAIKGES